MSLSKAVAAYLRSRQDPTKRMAFITQHKAQSCKETLKTKVEALIFQTRYTQEHTGETFEIWRAAMDTGGGGADGEEWTRTEEIYQWIRQFGGNTVFGVKGASRPQLKRVKVSIIDKMARGNRPIPGGLELRILDVDQFKRLFHWRM